MLKEKLAIVQSKLKAPKSQRNSFGNYDYRSCEDILEAVKPLLFEYGLVLTISDDIVNLGNIENGYIYNEGKQQIQKEGSRFYVKATATIYDDKESISVTAFAREEFNKKGMDASQVTGASSSYARKYALNGMFLIDDTKDADHGNNHDDKSSLKKETVESPTKVSIGTITGTLQAISESKTKDGKAKTVYTIIDKSLFTHRIGTWGKANGLPIGILVDAMDCTEAMFKGTKYITAKSIEVSGNDIPFGE